MIWIGDTGASRHMVQNDVFLWNKTVCNENVTMGNSEEVQISVKGDILFKVKDKSNKELFVWMKDCFVVPNLVENLMSLTRLMEQGFTLGNIKKNITITKNNITFIFDKEI